MPDVVVRVGVDLDPVDVTDADDARNLLATHLENTRLANWSRGTHLLEYADAVLAAVVGT